MLYSVELRLAIVHTWLSRLTPYHLYSLFLSLIAKSSPRLAEELHKDAKSPKPYTLALIGGRLPWQQRIPASTVKGLNLRLTFLNETVFTALADAVWHLSSTESLPLAEGRVTCELLATSPSQSQWATFSSFAELLETAPQEKRLELVFFSPTTFRSGGRRNVLFPEPSLVFKSLAARWNAFAPPALLIDLSDPDVSATRLSAYRLSTCLMDFGGYQEAGFYGTASYDVAGEASADTVKKLQVLTSFAFFSGIGAKTTMGMGQARRGQYARSLPDRARGNATQGRRHIPRHQG